MPKFIFEDGYYFALSDLLLAIRNARAAWGAAKAGTGEWDSFSSEIRRGQRGGALLATQIDEARSRAAGWWKRANARTHRPAESQNSRNSQRPLLL